MTELSQPGEVISPPVEMMQIPEEFTELLDFYRGLAPLRTLEVGSKAGGTLWGFAQNAPRGATIVSLDLAAPNKHLYDKWAAEHGINIQVVEADSQAPATAERIRDLGPYDFVFIDAAHDYPSVKHDWETYGTMSDGPVAFHDIHHVEGRPETWDNCQVWILWREIQADGRLTREIIHDYGQCCYGIGLVL